MLNQTSRQKGAGLIEVLASMLVITTGVLGMLSVQNRSVQFNQGAMYESKASILAGDIIDRIRANPTVASRYRIGLNESNPSHSACNLSSAECSVNQIADYDVTKWREEIAATLPDGKGEVSEIPGPGSISIYVVTVQYQDKRADEASAYMQNTDAETPPKSVVFRTSI